jgi:uncharacterized protein YbjT (DUF2867 family)
MKILLFGATGTAGGDVLKACVADPSISEVRVIARRAPATAHPKIRLFLHENYLDYAPVASAFSEIAACYFCLGISVRQVSSEAEYRTITIDYARAAAALLRMRNEAATFHYLSGQGARLNSRFMWARVKAEAEQILLEESSALCWRPGFIDGANSQRAPRSYQLVRPLFRQLRFIRSIYVSGDDLGRAMITATRRGLRGCILENSDIRALADAGRAESSPLLSTSR